MNVDDAVSSMTLEEKCTCLTGEGYWMLGGCARLGIEPILVSDGPHGLRKQAGAADNLGLAASEPAVSFPTASAVACTFNLDLMRTMGEALGDEAREQGVAVLLGPGVNMKRSPLCGRNFEYFSEDPCLAGELGAAYIQGVQSCGVGTSLKHFACNNQETNRLIVDAVVDERALHEVYLEPFRRAVEQGRPWTVMTAYNLLNGAYCSEDAQLMERIAREEWGFEGVFVTDWGAENDNLASLPAGLDLVMPGPRADYRREVAEAVSRGVLSEADLDRAVSRILGLHEQHVSSANIGIKRSQAERLDVARAVAEEAAVLLENDGILPLDAAARIAVVGAFARKPRYQGAGSSKINPASLDCAFEALEAAGVPVAFAPGYDADTGEATEEQLAEAVRVVSQAEVAVVFVGLPDASESEGSDRMDMALPAGHNALVERVCAANPNTVIVLQGGSPVELPWRGKPRAILLSYLSGCRGGRATADLLLGVANPSGKLAETWPLRLADTPCADFFPAQGRQASYRESIYTGYRYYDAVGIEVAYPFGHGLSYTAFSYRDMRVADADEGFEVSFTVRNDGDRAGKEVVQLYVAPRDAQVFKAPQQLKGFAKVELAPGEERRVALRVPRSSFAHYCPAEGAWDVEAGTYELRVSSSSRDVRLCREVQVAGKAAQPDNAPGAYHRVAPGCFTEEAFALLYGRRLPKVLTPLRPYTANATVGDLQTSLLGKAVCYLLRRELKLLLPGDVAQQKSLELLAMDTPLRMLAMSGMDMNLVAGIVDIMNYHFLRGIKRLRSLKPAKQDEAAEASSGKGAAQGAGQEVRTIEEDEGRCSTSSQKGAGA
ncbi:MAG: glycoside hydrolase family 3 C-terminal domain-containing protein [Gordonibacter sp.]|uniref:glycoside hydrolase family 3 C-terminal domain-containing protein n=1 Tax=Gordonibacter sp. TaxID=1968902 RepID=UPI002FCB65DD